jgi:DNA-binding MarR family transcriptional regulator
MPTSLIRKNPPLAPPAEPAPRGCTNLKLRRLSRAVSRWYDEDVRSLGLKGSQYSLLSHVVKLAPVQPGALARAMGLDASTLTRNLRPLLDAGWVALQPGPDARSRLVVATPAGALLREQAQRRWRASQERINQTLGPARVVALHALMDECTALLLAADEDEPGAPDEH